LFADIVGSMVLAERLDPERLRVVTAEVTRRCAECVTRFEGIVDKFTGDGVSALFGAPVALEDHARRACYAGLEMQRSVAGYAAELKAAEGIELWLRVGINSGEVIVGDIATAGRLSGSRDGAQPLPRLKSVTGVSSRPRAFRPRLHPRGQVSRATRARRAHRGPARNVRRAADNPHR
jgi:hypothetical protein